MVVLQVVIKTSGFSLFDGCTAGTADGGGCQRGSRGLVLLSILSKTSILMFGRWACWRAARLQVIPAALRHKSNAKTRQELLQQVVWECYQGSLYIISASHTHTHTLTQVLFKFYSTLINAAISSLWLKELCILLPLKFQPSEIFFFIFVYLKRQESYFCPCWTPHTHIWAEPCDGTRAPLEMRWGVAALGRSLISLWMVREGPECATVI